MDKPYIEVPVLETPFIMIPTREPKLWGDNKDFAVYCDGLNVFCLRFC